MTDQQLKQIPLGVTNLDLVFKLNVPILLFRLIKEVFPQENIVHVFSVDSHLENCQVQVEINLNMNSKFFRSPSFKSSFRGITTEYANSISRIQSKCDYLSDVFSMFLKESVSTDRKELSSWEHKINVETDYMEQYWSVFIDWLSVKSGVTLSTDCEISDVLSCIYSLEL